MYILLQIVTLAAKECVISERIRDSIETIIKTEFREVNKVVAQEIVR